MNSGTHEGVCTGISNEACLPAREDAFPTARAMAGDVVPFGGLLESSGRPFTATVSTSAPPMTYARISLEDARQLLDDDGAFVVDIRDEASFAAARIEHARHLDDATLAAFLAEADRDVPLIVCCYHGHSSQSAGAMLAERGFAQVYSLDGGFTGWAARYPDDVEGEAVA